MKKHFAFVACNRNPRRFLEDPSYIYRCENLAAALKTKGHRVSLLHINAVSWRDHFDVAIFHRPRQSLRLRMLLKLLRHRGSLLVADFDDLVFDEALAKFSPGVANGMVSLDATCKQFNGHRRALEQFDCITVSTEPLAEHVRRYRPDAWIETVPNAVHCRWRKISDAPVGQPQMVGNCSQPVITYFPGTRSHDRDFATVANGLAAFLSRYPDVRLQITGHLRFALTARPGQVIHREKVPFEEFHDHIRGAWLNLAPLEETPFTRCKSAVKVLEAGYWRIPTLCSPIPDTSRFLSSGALPVTDGEVLYGQLEAFLDPARYQLATDNLRERVLEVADVQTFAEQFVRFVNACRMRTG